MLQIHYSFEEVSQSNLFLLIRNQFDLEKLQFLHLEEKVFSKLQSLVNDQKNTTFRYFLGREDFEEVVLFFYLDASKDIYDFLWENIEKIPDTICFEYQKDEIILDSIILWKYNYQAYKSEKKELSLSIICQESEKKLLSTRLSTLNNISDARDIINTGSSDKTPDKYTQHIKNIKLKNTRVKILDYDDIKREWLWLLEAVWKASTSKPRLVILERIVDKKLPTFWFVGKWITFDTGGLNIKVWDGMYGMKDDMAGSAALLYMMKEIDEKDLHVNVITALPIAENSIAWDAYRPWDILTSYSGKTVEITNTDAEGRLVLADGISYISKNYTLESITTIATLTWACMVALGYNYAGIMWDNKEIIQKLLQTPSLNAYWELPMDDFLSQKTSGTISDYINYTSWVMAGASMWWAFLKNFCLKKEKFTHIDIAWPSFLKERYKIFSPGATWFWVESLSQLLLSYGKTSER